MYDSEHKNHLIKSLITRIVELKEVVDLKFEPEFYESHKVLIKHINSRKQDIPSLSHLETVYKFTPVDTDLTITDIIEQLNLIYYYEKSNEALKQMLAARKAGRDNSDALTSLDQLQKQFGKIKGNISKSTVLDLVNESEKIAEEYQKVKQNVVLIPTGIKRLDEFCAPRLGNFMMISAKTGGMKSMLMTYMQAAANKAGISSLYISLEMSLVEQTNRLLSVCGICPFSELHSNNVTQDEYKSYLKQLNSVPTHILTRTTENRIDIPTIEKYIAELRPSVIYLDYLTLLQGSDFAWNSEISASSELKRIALQYNTLMVTAVQADSNILANGEIPDLHNVRGNKSFSFDADIFLGLATERYLPEPDKFRLSMAIRKNRNGVLGEFVYKVKPETGLFQDTTEEAAAGIH